MVDEYEYHKQNDYPGERTAEKKRVADRDAAADRRSDYRVAEKGRVDGLNADNRVARKGRMDDRLMDAEIERSTERAAETRRSRNTSDRIGLIVIAGVLVILLAGLGWSFMAIRQQANENQAQADQIDSLNAQAAGYDTVQSSQAQLGSANRQIQLYKDFMVMTADASKEVKGLRSYNASYANLYQLCANYMGVSNDVNHAMNRFAEKEIVYYSQIANLTNRTQCYQKIAALNATRAGSKAADEEYYLQSMNECTRMMGNQTAENMTLQVSWKYAQNDAEVKSDAFTAAEKEVIACFS